MAGPVENTAANNNGESGASQETQPTPQPKFLGKYSSVEEAERGYKELERFAYEQSRQAADARKQLEQLASNQIPGSAYGYVPAGQVPGYPGFIDPRQEAELQEFSVNPLSYLNKRDEKVRRQAAEEIRREVRAELSARDTLSQWKGENPDLVRHEPLVATFVAQQPAHLSVREKLDRAAEETRRYLASELARSGQGRQAPQPGTFVESPGGAPVPAQSAQYQEPATSEAELADFVRERNAWKDKRMTVR